MLYLGDFAEDDTVNIPFNTFTSDDPSASATITNLADADIKVAKDGAATPITTDGATVVINLDSITGNHMITIDTSVDAAYSTGSEYQVRIEGTTVDGGTINAWVGCFSIERAGGVLALVKAGVTLAAGAITDASLAGNMEIVFETDFGTNYNTTRNAWATNVQDQVGTGNLTADVIAISGDSTAANNLELMYDTTGYTDSTAPASRSQVDGLTASSGGSVNIAASQDNTSGSIDPGSTTKVWATVSGTFANTEADNGLSHDFTDFGDDISHVYGFNVGGGRTATAVDFIGNVDGNNDEMQIEVWDHVGADWEVIGTILGTGATINKTLDLPLLLKHTGTSAAEIGKVYIQMDTNSTTPSDLSVELLLVSAVNIGQTVGYEGGQIWINTGGATNTNTESFVDGVADNTVSTIAAAKTISTNTGLSDFHIINGSTITLAESTANESYFGDNWTLVLNNQACGGAHFDGASVSGIQTGTNCGFHRGEVGTITIADDAHFESMGLSATITLPAGTVEFFNCHHDGASTPILDYGAVGDTTVHMHDYHGAIEVHNMGDSGTDILHLDGHGVLTVNANGTGGTVHLKGTWKVTNTNATINFSDETDDINAILVDTAEIGTAGAGLTNINLPNQIMNITGDITGNLSGSVGSNTELGPAEVNAECDTAISDAALATATNLATVDTNVDDLKLGIIFGAAATGTLSTTQCTSDLSGFTDDQLIGRVIVFTAGPADGEATDITDYADTNGLLTFTALTLAPENGNAFKVI